MAFQSRIYFARADASIADCVRQMRDKNIGALLVFSDTGKEELIGIFTERDLVKKIELVQNGDFWNTPIRTVMTKNLRTISPEEIDQAAKIMLQFGIRHLPILEGGSDIHHVIGVVSMRDLFQKFSEKEQAEKTFGKLPGKPAAEKKQDIGVLTADASIHKLIVNIFRDCPDISISFLSPKLREGTSMPAPILEKMTGFVIDLDGQSQKNSLGLLNQLLASSPGKLVAALYSPFRQDAAFLAELEKRNPNPSLSIFAKPIDIVAFRNLFR